MECVRGWVSCTLIHLVTRPATATAPLNWLPGAHLPQLSSYKEDIAIVGATIEAALAADLPPGATRTLYLCDDGKVHACATVLIGEGGGE